MPTKKLTVAEKTIRAFPFAKFGVDVDPRAADAKWVAPLATKIEMALRKEMAAATSPAQSEDTVPAAA